MNCRFTIWCSAAALAVLIAACVSFTPELKNDAAADAKKAYVFGRFHLTLEQMNANITLNVEGEGQKYVLPLKEHNDIYAIEVVPGTYHIASVSFLGKSRDKMGDRSLMGEKRLTEPFEIKAGELFYIGDYFGRVKKSDSRIQYLLEEVKNDYQQTLRRTLTKYAAFKKLKPRSMYEDGV